MERDDGRRADDAAVLLDMEGTEGDAGHDDGSDAGDRDERGAYYQEDTPWYLAPLQNPAVQRAWDVVQPVLYGCYVTCDYIGEKVADALGLTQSRFQYVIDEHNRRERRKQQKEEFIRKRLLEERAKERERLGIPDPAGNAVSMPATREYTIDAADVAPAPPAAAARAAHAPDVAIAE